MTSSTVDSCLGVRRRGLNGENSSTDRSTVRARKMRERECGKRMGKRDREFRLRGERDGGNESGREGNRWRRERER